jgi:hypothetical protein
VPTKIPFSGFHQCNIATLRSKLATISIRQGHDIHPHFSLPSEVSRCAAQINVADRGKKQNCLSSKISSVCMDEGSTTITKAKQSHTLKCLIFGVNPRREIHYDVRWDGRCRYSNSETPIRHNLLVGRDVMRLKQYASNWQHSCSRFAVAMEVSYLSPHSSDWTGPWNTDRFGLLLVLDRCPHHLGLGS